MKNKTELIEYTRKLPLETILEGMVSPLNSYFSTVAYKEAWIFILQLITVAKLQF